MRSEWWRAALEFDISPSGEFLGLPANGKRVKFSENVFYEYEGGKIVRYGQHSTKLRLRPCHSRSHALRSND
ncbi:ester cyclase [Rhizobium sp. G21]|uniref:ester cyclase n=1 Tax=Rhizobium sp. G21 TaxID=2758439 RepID=UPI0039180216